MVFVYGIHDSIFQRIAYHLRTEAFHLSEWTKVNYPAFVGGTLAQF